MRRRALVRPALTRTALMAGVWWALAEGVPWDGVGGATIASAAVVGAAAASLALLPPEPPRMRLRRLPAFSWFFARRSLVGGLDVARRALLPGGVVRPGFVDFRTDLARGSPRALFMEVVSLLPGTLVAGDRDGVVQIHVLDSRLPYRRYLRETEEQVRALFAAD